MLRIGSCSECYMISAVVRILQREGSRVSQREDPLPRDEEAQRLKVGAGRSADQVLEI